MIYYQQINEFCLSFVIENPYNVVSLSSQIHVYERFSRHIATVCSAIQILPHTQYIFQYLGIFSHTFLFCLDNAHSRNAV